MHTVVQRVSATLTLAVTALAILCGLVSFSDLLHPSGVAPLDIRVKGVDAIFVHKGVEQVRGDSVGIPIIIRRRRSVVENDHD